jgi:alanine dehydrogenase
VAMIGTGWQARSQALALSRVFEIKQLRAYSRDAERRDAFAREQSEELGLDAVAVDSGEEAVRGADVVVTMTSSATPVLEADGVEPHALVIGAGSNFPHRSEIPPGLVERAQTVVVDQLGGATLESGDLIAAHEAGKFDWSRAVELGPLIAGRWKRPATPGITLFESHGMALWDLAAGVSVLAAARERGMSTELDLL